MKDDLTAKALHLAYCALLELPPGNLFRVTHQQVYAALRDAIAHMTGREPEDVQNEYEALTASSPD